MTLFLFFFNIPQTGIWSRRGRERFCLSNAGCIFILAEELKTRLSLNLWGLGSRWECWNLLCWATTTDYVICTCLKVIQRLRKHIVCSPLRQQRTCFSGLNFLSSCVMEDIWEIFLDLLLRSCLSIATRYSTSWYFYAQQLILYVVLLANLFWWPFYCTQHGTCVLIDTQWVCHVG